MLAGGAPACQTDCPDRERHLLLSRIPGMTGMCVPVLLHLHIRCARDWGQSSLVVGPLSGAGKTDAEYWLPFSLFFSFFSQGDDTGNDAETWEFCRHIICGLICSADFHVDPLRVLLPAWWSFGSCVHEATRVLLAGTHVYNEVDRL